MNLICPKALPPALLSDPTALMRSRTRRSAPRSIANLGLPSRCGGLDPCWGQSGLQLNVRHRRRLGVRLGIGFNRLDLTLRAHFAGKFVEKADLAEHRTHFTYLPHHPLDRFVAGIRIS